MHRSTLTTLYQIGTTVIFGFASVAGRAAWISVLISTCIGVGINLLYVTLMHMHPGLTLVQWYPKQFGKWLGTPIAWMYPLQLLYVAGRIIGDLRFLIPNTLLPKTPHVIISSIVLIVAAYALFSGIEIIGRLGELFFPIIILLFFTQVILILSSDIINPQYIKPITGKGWKTIWESVWPLGITQTFGQTIEFAMIWPLVKESKKIFKVSAIATIISGIVIASLDILAVLVLGEGTFSRSIFPMFRLIRIINVGNFIENLDAINVLLFLTTAFFKICLHLFAAIRGIQQLSYAKNSRVFILPAIVIVLYLGMNMAANAPEHIEAGLKILPYNLWILLFFVLPGILFIVAWIRNRFKITIQ